ncbi:hypothetical protein [Variovorax boronicumulans]|uniref:hypothetical protein n=1 Tax=Variovorax boronicumulans TaxID=436515 RepID=UPI0027D78C21|nr:hypothetical protein [Variovorax boronicumulans]
MNVASKMFSAVDRDELQTLQDEFAEIKHGDALMYLETGVVDASVAVYNRSIIAMQTLDGEDFRKGVQCALAGHPFTLAVACRQMVSDAFLRESGVPLPTIQATYSMSWKGACEQADEQPRPISMVAAR